MLKKLLLMCFMFSILPAVLISCKSEGDSSESSQATDTASEGTTTAAEDPDAWKADYNSKQIINDNEFKNGFYVVQESPRAYVGPWRTTDSEETVAWTIAQWGTFNSYSDRSGYQCLWGDDKNPADNILENNINKVIYDEEEKKLTLAMNSYEFFNGQPHVDNSSWPHLLIEQGIIDKNALLALPEEERIFYTLAADKIILELDVKMPVFTHKNTGGIMACQFLSYYYICSTEDGGFTWFGLPIFDDRGYANYEEPSFTVDTGSGLLIYGIPQYAVYRNSTPNGGKTFFNPLSPREITPSDEWVHIEIDMKPWLEKMAARAMGPDDVGTYPKTTELSQMFFYGLNLGFELHGTYDVTFEIKNYKITTYVKK